MKLLKRTFWITPAMDEYIKAVARKNKVSKGFVVRVLLLRGRLSSRRKR